MHTNDDLQPVITARAQIDSVRHEQLPVLPQTAVLFYAGKAKEYLLEQKGARELPAYLPRFLNHCPIWMTQDEAVCYLDGGRGAPQAADTVETLAALGVKNIIAVGMIGAFDDRVKVGQVIAPSRAYIEEGTTPHYCGRIEFSAPDGALHAAALSALNVEDYPIVSTDAVYRQTFRKERQWRDMGAVGVDMETSAVFSVSRFLGLRAAAVVMVSDRHPMTPDAPKWDWRMTLEMRHELFEMGIALAKHITSNFI